MSLRKIYYILALQFVVLFSNTMNLFAAPDERTFLHTDRTVYIAGQTVFYKLYVLDATTRNLSNLSKVGYILFRDANSNHVLKIRVDINRGVSSGCIELPDTLCSGVYQAVAFTSVMRNKGEQHFGFKDIVVANRYDKELNFKLLNSEQTPGRKGDFRNPVPTIKTDRMQYGPREKVSISLGNLNSKANVSVSVYEEPRIVTANTSIVETLAGTPVENAGVTSKGYYQSENRGKIVRGRVLDATLKKGIPAAIVLLSSPDTLANLQYARTDSDGRFQLLLSDYYAGKDLFFTIKDVPVNQKWIIEMEDGFSLAAKWKPALMPNNSDAKEFIEKSGNIVYINNSYQVNNDRYKDSVLNRNVICPQVYNCPVNKVYPGDFVPLKDFPEITVELLPKVIVSHQNNQYSVRVINAAFSTPFQQAPAVFMDGVFVDDVNKIIGLGSDRIKKIEVLSCERIIGDVIFQGIISITTKSNEILKSIPASHSCRIKNDYVSCGKNFVSINPIALNKNIPYLTQLLYWNPMLEVSATGNADVELYTSDNTASFRIQVEGVLEDGTPISSGSSFQVINPLNSNDK